MNGTIPPIVVMGVQGVGKSTIAALLAERLGARYIDGDALHPERNVELMRAGTPLTDDDRWPWLDRVAGELSRSAETGIVIACSALKRAYRDRIRAGAPETFIVHLEGDYDLIAERIATRRHEYMPSGLLRSQFDILEPLGEDEHGTRVDIAPAPEQIVAEIATTLEGGAAA